MRLGVILDPLGSLNPKKDSTCAMLRAAAARHFEVSTLEITDLAVSDGVALGHARPFEYRGGETPWYRSGEGSWVRLDTFDILLMRKDPPVDAMYLYATQILELAEQAGTLVVNRPQALRDFNEKLFATWFPSLMPATLVTSDARSLKDFLATQGDIALKPLGGMGGRSVFRVRTGDANVNVILETLTGHGREYAMAQRFVPEIRDGDKRILMINGEPVPYALARIPAEGETRGNLAAGGRGEGRPLGESERRICEAVGPVLQAHGIWFAGLDVIGDRLTEINLTSPTGIQELDRIYNLDIAGQLIDALVELRRDKTGA